MPSHTWPRRRSEKEPCSERTQKTSGESQNGEEMRCPHPRPGLRWTAAPRGPRMPSERVPPWEGRSVKPNQGGGFFAGSQHLFGRSQMSKSTATAQALTPCPPQSGRESGGGGQRRLTVHSKPRRRHALPAPQPRRVGVWTPLKDSHLTSWGKAQQRSKGRVMWFCPCRMLNTGALTTSLGLLHTTSLEAAAVPHPQ